MLGLGDLHKGMKDRAQVLTVTDAVEKQGTLKGYLGSGPSSKHDSYASIKLSSQINLNAVDAGQIKIELDDDKEGANDNGRQARSVLDAGV